MSRQTGYDVKRKIESQQSAYDAAYVSAKRKLERAEAAVFSCQETRSNKLRAISNEHVKSLVVDGKQSSLSPHLNHLVLARAGIQTDMAARLKSESASLQALEKKIIEATKAANQAEIDLATAKTSSPSIVDATKELEEARVKAQEAADSADSIVSECYEKFCVYHEDDFFMHLRSRKYGTHGYKGSFLFAVYDRWLASRINFDAAVRDFEVLEKLPVLAREKAEEARLDAEQKKIKLESMVDSLDQDDTRDAANAKLKSLASAQSSAVDLVRNLEEAIRRYEKKTDREYSHLVETVIDLLSKMDRDSLAGFVQKIGSPVADAALKSYFDAAIEEDALELKVVDARADIADAKKKRDRATDLLDHFTRSQYDRSRRVYTESFDVDAMMTGYILGQISQSTFDSNVSSCSRVEELKVSAPSRDDDSRSGYGSGSGSGSSWSSSDDSSRNSSWSSSDSFGGSSSSGSSSSSSDSGSSSHSTSDSF